MSESIYDIQDWIVWNHIFRMICWLNLLLKKLSINIVSERRYYSFIDSLTHVD